jgi:hypothetical protein
MKKKKKILLVTKYIYPNKLDQQKMEYSHRNQKEEIKIFSQVSRVILKIILFLIFKINNNLYNS